MKQEEPNPASAKEKAEGSRENVNVPPGKKRAPSEFDTRPDLDGKTDSGPEPEVHGRELPPQK